MSHIVPVATPAFHVFLRPVLESVVATPGIHWTDAANYAATYLNLTDADKDEIIPSGQPKWINRTMWALSYLRQAKLIEKAGRGLSNPTDRGIKYLSEGPLEIKPADLMVFPEFVEFFKSPGTTGATPPGDGASVNIETTPQEAIALAHAALRAELASSLLDQLKQVTPQRFEQIIVDLMLKLGYGGPRSDAGQALGRTGDGGIDGIVRQDRLGLDNIYLQAKRYTDTTVGTGEVNAFIGALTTRGANKGVLITTSTFSESAKKVALSAPHLKLSLIDGKELASLMIDCNLGVAIESVYEIKRIDSDFFVEE